MRTTVAINDQLLIESKRRARERGLTLGQFLDAALQRELAEPAVLPSGPPIPFFDGGGGTLPGVDLTSNRAIYELLDEGMDIDQMH